MFNGAPFFLVAAIAVSSCASQPDPFIEPEPGIDPNEYHAAWNDCMEYTRELLEVERDMRSVGSGRGRGGGFPGSPAGEYETSDEQFGELEGTIPADGDSLRYFRQCMAREGYQIRR